MRWTKRYSRIVKCFALFPILDEWTDEWHWLEVLYIKQRRGCYGFWYNLKLTTKEDYLEYRRLRREEK